MYTSGNTKQSWTRLTIQSSAWAAEVFWSGCVWSGPLLRYHSTPHRRTCSPVAPWPHRCFLPPFLIIPAFLRLRCDFFIYEFGHFIGNLKTSWYFHCSSSSSSCGSMVHPRQFHFRCFFDLLIGSGLASPHLTHPPDGRPMKYVCVTHDNRMSKRKLEERGGGGRRGGGGVHLMSRSHALIQKVTSRRKKKKLQIADVYQRKRGQMVEPEELLCFQSKILSQKIPRWKLHSSEMSDFFNEDVLIFFFFKSLLPCFKCVFITFWHFTHLTYWSVKITHSLRSDFAVKDSKEANVSGQIVP